MPNYNFSKDLPVAKKTEQEVAELLKTLYKAEITKFCNSSKFDILAKIEEKEYSFEVKEDFMSWKTGNVALEFECRGKPSGILTSEANFYIYKIHGKNGIHFYLFKTKTLKEMVEKKEFHRIVSGGDEGSNSMNYLFKYENFIRHGRFMV